MQLISPFPVIGIPLVWEWLNEFPERNLDDYGPQTAEECALEVKRRIDDEFTWGVEKDGELVGIIGYCPITPRWGSFHGICFTRKAWGRETTLPAVRGVLDQLFACGVAKVSASYFADNLKIRRFLFDLGAVDEGYLRAQTLRRGVPVDMHLIAIFKEL